MGEFDRGRLPETMAYFDSEALPLRGPGKWKTAECVFHGGSDSMRVNAESGGWVCMACGEKGGDVLAFHMRRHGLNFVSAAKALGAYSDSAQPERPRRARKLAPADALEVLYQDALLVWVAAWNLVNGVVLTDRDRTDLTAAMRRVTLVSQEAKS